MALETMKDLRSNFNGGEVVKQLKAEIKELKKNYNQCHQLNQKLHQHLQELTQSSSIDIEAKCEEIRRLNSIISDDKLTLTKENSADSKAEQDRVAKVYKLLSQICQSNYQYMQQSLMSYSLSSSSGGAKVDLSMSQVHTITRL